VAPSPTCGRRRRLFLILIPPMLDWFDISLTRCGARISGSLAVTLLVLMLAQRVASFGLLAALPPSSYHFGAIFRHFCSLWVG